MTSLKSTVGRLFGRLITEVTNAPAADFTFAPTTAEEAASILDLASEHRLAVLPWGGGSHQWGGKVDPDIILSTSSLRGIDWRPDDLTAVVGAGVTVADLEQRLGEKGQSAVLVEDPTDSTVGGVVASAASGWRRLRYGPTRDRMLEVVAATGDGRVIRGGGQVVKNVSGYDLPRLFTGSLGSLGVVTRVCLKLWPQGEAQATVSVRDPERAMATAHAPLAVLETPQGTSVYLAGTAREVEAQANALKGSAESGLIWPKRPSGTVALSVRVPSAFVTEAVDRVSWAEEFVASHGVGEVIAAGEIATDVASDLRHWAEVAGGSVVVTNAPEGFDLDRWGEPPASLVLQRRVKAAFDPVGVMVPGRLPGGV